MDSTVDACCVVSDNTSRNKITVEANVLENEMSTQAICLCSQSKQAYHHIHRESPLITGSGIRERQLKPVLLSKFIFSPLPYI